MSNSKKPIPLQEPQRFYVAKRFCSWDTLSSDVGIRLNVEAEPVGYLPVYASLESLRKEYPDADYVEIVTTHTAARALAKGEGKP